MRLAAVGCAVLACYLFTGWTALIVIGLVLMVFGLMFGYRPVTADLVWQKLVKDGVIDNDGRKPE